ncbi:glycosyltransferase family 2 protein [Bacillus cereus]|uniref:glycosyltransferase family 2 protein n=1 Tax=Bacillus cereus TaxID=1396 RepID=UPI00211D5C32|nr:glycosyltransferase family 2 protein [Bacillus cereus]
MVSILIPTFNRPLYFQLALQSALHQTYPNIEIIIGDDSTNDETEKLVTENFLPFYKQIKYIRNRERLGQFENDSMLLDQSEGEYINYLMDDDLYAATKIETMMNYYILDTQQEIKLITSYRKLIDSVGNFLEDIWSTKPLFTIDTILSGKELGKKMITNQCNFIGEPTTVLFRKKDLIYPFGMFKNRKYLCNVDVASWLTLLSQGKMIYIAEPLSYFRLHANQQLNEPNKLIDGLKDWYDGIKIGKENGFFNSREDYVKAAIHFITYSKRVAEPSELEKLNFSEFFFNI